MKRLILTIVTGFAASCATIKQVPNPVELDFRSLKDIPETHIARNTKFQVKINNINRSLFTINDSTAQVSYSTDLPDILTKIPLPGILNTKLPSILVNKSAFVKDPIEDALEKINEEHERIYEVIILGNTLKTLNNDCEHSYAYIDSMAKIAVGNLIPASAGGNRAQQSAAIDRYINDAVKEARKALAKLDKELPEFYKKQNDIIQRNKKNFIWKWENNPVKKTDPQFENFGLIADSAKYENDKIKTAIEDIKARYEKAKEIVTEISKFAIENKKDEIIVLYNLINPGNFTYYTKKIDVTEDVVAVNINITPNKTLPCNVENNTKIAFNLTTIGGWKVDFSSGVFLMGGSNQFIGEEYYYESLDSTTSFIRKKDGGKRLLLGVGALMHIYYRTGQKVNFAISPGVSTTTGFDGVNFHLGGSLLTSGKNRFGITAGATMREVKILDRSFQTDKAFAKKILPDDVPTIKVFPKFGWFLSLTYNWSRLQKQEEK